MKITENTYGMTYVDSSFIREIGVKDDDLIVVIKGGATYSYHGASCEYANLLKANSAGAYFATIKCNYNGVYLGNNVIRWGGYSRT